MANHGRDLTTNQVCRVIFTIKDYQGNLVAQQISQSIMITDDHKTHGQTSSLTVTAMGLPEGHQLPAGGIFPTASPFDMSAVFAHHPAPFRMSHSTNDLQGLRHHFSPPNSHHMRQFTGNLNGLNGMSATTSATTTPRNLSRPASPSAQPPPSAKKRKSSGASRAQIPQGLTMTKLETTSGPSSTITSAAPSPYNGGLNNTNPFVPTSEPQTYMNTPMQATSSAGTGPPTPISNTGMVTPGFRPNSVENFSQTFFSAPTSAHPSRAPSPSGNRQHFQGQTQQQFQHSQFQQAIANMAAGIPLR